MGDLLPYPSSCTETNLDPGRDARRDERATAEPCAGGRMPRHGLSRLLSELCISISPAAPPPLRWKLLPPPPTAAYRAFGLSFLSLQWSNLPLPPSACRNFLVVSGREGRGGAFRSLAEPFSSIPAWGLLSVCLMLFLSSSPFLPPMYTEI